MRSALCGSSQFRESQLRVRDHSKLRLVVPPQLCGIDIDVNQARGRNIERVLRIP